MIASYSEYLKKKALLASGGDFSEEAVAKVQAALDEYDNNFLAKGAAANEMPLKPDEGVRLIGEAAKAQAPTQDELAQQLIARLDPSHPLVPQALAIQPATTHPKGDDAAKDEWLRGDLDNPNGKVVVYDAPARVVRKDLVDNPQLFAALGLEAPLSPDAVMTIKPGDSTYQAYNDFKWREAAGAAAKKGKTAYRFSKAPYLGDGKSASILNTLSTKVGYGVLPAAEQAQAFVLGVDKGADFGAGGAIADTNAFAPSDKPGMFQTEESKKRWDASMKNAPRRESKDEIVGGIPEGTPPRERNDMVKEENPLTYTGGDILGTLAPWGLANKVFGGALGVTGKALAGPGAGALRTGAAELAGSALGGAAVQAGHEAVNAGASYAQTGSAGTTLPEVGGRLKDAAEGGAAWSLPGVAAQGLGNAVRTSARYEGLPGTVEKLNGGKVYPFVGHATPPVVSEAQQAARARSIPVEPVDVLAENLKAPLTEAAKGHVAEVKAEVHRNTAEVKASPEGRQLLPAEKTAKTALAQLRERTSSAGGDAPTPVGVPNADRPVKGIFNSNIEGVSVRPRKGWIPVSVKESESFLSPVWRKRALRAANTPHEPVMRPGTRRGEELATVPEGGALAARETPTGIERAEPGGPLARRQPPEPTPEASMRAPGAAHPELEASNTRFSPEGPDHRRASVPPSERPATNTEPTGGGPILRGSRPQRPTEATAHETGPQGEPAPKNPKMTSSYEGPRGSRWKRRGEGEPEAAPAETSQEWKKNIQPGTYGQEMARRGVKTVYVAPRRYDAEHHETVIRQLRRKGADTPNDRDLTAIYHAALEDRDARTWQGEPGAWSAMQQRHQAQIGAAKETQKLAAPNPRAAYQAVVGVGNHQPGQSENVRALEDTAARAGGNALEQLRGARVMQPLARLKSMGGFGRQAHGGAFGLSALSDAMMLRGIYPVTRALEGRQLGRLATVGTDRDQEAAARRARDEQHRGEYETKVGSIAGQSASTKPKVKRRSRHIRKETP